MQGTAKPEDARRTPTDFTTCLAERLRLTPEAAEEKLAGWLMRYVPVAKRNPSARASSKL